MSLPTFEAAGDRSDATAFLGRVVRLDPAALVRLRSSGGALTLWSWLPLDTLAARTVRGAGEGDVTVPAKALLDALTAGASALPPRRDEGWRGAIPPDTPAEQLDAVPAEVVNGLLASAEKAFREASSGGDPQVVGDALLDQEVLQVTGGAHTVGIPLRALLSCARMGFLGDDPIRVVVAGGWVGIRASFGVVYLRRGGRLALFPTGR
ncbi:MAG: hypothetical protein QOJ50_2511 [Cryptosporangiaceae bacterium]|nr:hypothetical protein [Cryptosporangiaceae bacterium]